MWEVLCGALVRGLRKVAMESARCIYISRVREQTFLFDENKEAAAAAIATAEGEMGMCACNVGVETPTAVLGCVGGK